MSLRAKLILAFLLLAVLPLTAIVGYSYSSSLASLHEVVEAENREAASDLRQRMSVAKQEVQQRLARLRRVSLSPLVDDATSAGEREGTLAAIDRAIGPAAPFVDGLVFVPASPSPPAPPSPPVPSAPRARAAPVASPVIPGGPLVIRLTAPKAPAADEEEDATETETAAETAAEARGSRTEIDLGAIEKLVSLTTQKALGAAFDRGMSEKDREAALERLDRDIEHRVAAIVRVTEGMAPGERKELAARREEERKLLGEPVATPVEQDGRQIGQLQPQIKARQLLESVLALTRRDRGEIPFAVASDGHVYVAHPDDLAQVQALTREGAGEKVRGDWVVVQVKDAESGLIYGIARPIRDSLASLRRTAGRNFGYGLALIGVALLGVAPLSRRITRDLSTLTDGARRLAAGDLDTRVPVTSRDEVGHLAAAFNQMAEDLRLHQQKLIEQERRQKEQEIERRLLAAENDRKTSELEEARRFQLSLLPKRLPEHPGFEIAVFMRTATEVGGDYYDFHHAADGTLTVAIGDATGHGAKAGTLVTVIKSLFTASAAGGELTAFLADAGRTIKSLELGRMAMALGLARISGHRLQLASAGMPPALVHRRASGTVDELAVPGLPLGSLSDCTYSEIATELAAGDTVLLLSDGLPELANAAGEVYGYVRMQATFAAAADGSAGEIVAALERAVGDWKDGAPPDDDVTFVVLKVR